MVRPQSLLADSQRPLVERLGLGIAALIVEFADARTNVIGSGVGCVDAEFLGRTIP